MQKYNVTITNADEQSIKNDISNANQTVDKFVVNLSMKERGKLPTIGDVRTNIVKKLWNAAEANPKIFPSTFNLKGFGKNWDTTQILDKLLINVKQLQEKIYETRQALSAQTYDEAKSARQYINTANDSGHPGLDVIVKELNELFARESDDDKSDDQ